MAGIDAAAFEAVDEAAVRCEVLHHHAQVRLVEDVEDLVQRLVYRLVQQGLVLDDGLDLQGHVADDHGQGEVLHGTGAGDGLQPPALRIRTAGQDSVEDLAGHIGIVFTARGDGQLGEGHAGEGVGKDIVRGDDGLPLAREREIEVVVPVMAVLLQEAGALLGAGEPGRILLHLVVQHGEHPDLPALQPDELVGVEDASVPVQASEIPAVLQVLGFLQPERQHAAVELLAIALGHGHKIGCVHMRFFCRRKTVGPHKYTLYH